MAKDYFQDIVPPHTNSSKRSPGTHSIPVHTPHTREQSMSGTIPHQHHAEMEENDEEDISVEAPLPVRGIRNIAPNPTRPGRSRIAAYGSRENHGGSKKSSAWWLWTLAVVCVAVLGSFVFISMRPTTITIVPRSQNIAFDETAQFVAYPQATAATGTLAYSVLSADLDDSQVVVAQGTEHVDARASGNITVYNNFSTTPQKFVKNTRFQTPEGLVFRTPADIVIPGRQGSTPGQVTVTVAADQAGPQYNIGPVAKFTLPGLQSNAPMYAGIYAQSTASMSGGSSGNQPAVAPADQTAALSEMRTRLEKSAHDMIAASSTPTTTMFASLMQITYQDMPSTTETDGSVRLHERAHIAVPVFDTASLASFVSQTVTANAGPNNVTLVGKDGYSAGFTASSTSVLGSDQINFSLLGNAQLVWQIDTAKLTKELAGRDEGAFQNIIMGFSGIQEANAKVEPFWKKTFPTDPTSIKIKIEAPQAAN